MVPRLRPIDYLIVGHVTEDLSPEGSSLGGAVTFAGLTAHALGKNVGVLTAAASTIDLQPLRELQVQVLDSNATSTFQNIYEPAGRRQQISSRADDLKLEMLPTEWSSVEILHCAPIANEVDAAFTTKVSSQWLCLTPQGWLRHWDDQGKISHRQWESMRLYLTPSSIVVLSLEDIGGTLEAANVIARECHILAITLGADGAMVYAGDESRHLKAPTVKPVDPTGCGDIFAATFFVCLEQGDDPWTAGAIANLLAAKASTREGLASIPIPDEIDDALQLRDL
jgi:sugar/nucleoside kinase (ribokinase family)